MAGCARECGSSEKNLPNGIKNKLRHEVVLDLASKKYWVSKTPGVESKGAPCMFPNGEKCSAKGDQI